MGAGLLVSTKGSEFHKRQEVAFPLNLLYIQALESKWVPEVRGECGASREEGMEKHSCEIRLERGAM